MKSSRKFLSLPIITLSEGQHIGYVKNLVLDPHSKSLAALIVDPKGFFKDQRIVPYTKVISVGDDAITIDKESHVEKSVNIPEILDLLKEKLNIIGTKVVTENGKTLGIASEYYIDPENGKITSIEIAGSKLEGFINGKAQLKAESLKTIGHDVIVAQKGSENELAVSDKGLSDTLKNIIHTTSHKASETTHTLSHYFKKDKNASPLNTSQSIEVAESDTNTFKEPEPVSTLSDSEAEPSNKEPQG